jgi:hypothetical protein
VARRGGDLAAVAADVGAVAAVGGGEGRAGFRADVFEGWAEGWDCGGDEDGALLEGRGVEVSYGAVWMGSVVLVSGFSRLGGMGEEMLTGEVPIRREDFIELDGTPYGSTASDTAEAKKEGSEPLCSSCGVKAHDHENWREDESTI